jgi:hypothetical protein
MSSTKEPERDFLLRVGGAAVSLAAGTLLLVTSIRDYLLYLDNYDLGMVGTAGSLQGVVLLSLIGSVLAVMSLHMTTSLSATKNA